MLFDTFKRFKRFYTKVAVLFLHTLIILALCNIMLFFAYKIFFRSAESNTPVDGKCSRHIIKKIYPDFTEEEVKALIKETWRERPFEYESFTQFKERPYKGRFVNIDKNGFRVSKNQGPWPPNRDSYNIFIFGGSTAFCYGLPDDQTIASYLQEALSATTAYDIRVYNFARGFYYISQERVFFEQLLSAGFVPDMALFIDGLNGSSGAFDDQPFFSERLRHFMDHSFHAAHEPDVCKNMTAYFNALPLVQLKHIAFLRKDARISSANEIKKYFSNINIIRAAAAAYSVQPVFVWQPIPEYKYDLECHPFLNDNLFRYPQKHKYQYLFKLQKERPPGNDFLWCADIQKGICEPLYVDRIHYTAKMTKLLSEAIAKMMFERNLIRLKKESVS